MANLTTEDEDLEAIVAELNDLIQLDLDAVKAYEIAIEKIDDQEAHDDLELFKLDHERHVEDLGRLVRRLGGEPKDSRDLKGVLIEGMTLLRSATGTLGALKAMRMNEKLTNKVYARALEKPLTLDAREVVLTNRDDERRHLAAIKAHLARLDADYIEDEDEDELLSRHEDDDDRPPVVI
jgi:uncharacterized protein (TIGR02284 family)